MKINQVLIQPLLTEKTTKMVSSNFFTFQVDQHANKNQVKEAIEKLYQAKVSAVQIMIRKGKIKKKGKKMMKRQLANRKIAIVKLSSGKISLFPQG